MKDTQLPQLGTIAATATRTQLWAALRVIITSFGMFAIIVGLLAKRDMAGLVAFLQQDSTITGLIALAGAVTFVWGQVSTRKRHQTTVTLAALPVVSDEVIRVEGHIPASVQDKLEAAAEKTLEHFPLPPAHHY